MNRIKTQIVLRRLMLVEKEMVSSPVSAYMECMSILEDLKKNTSLYAVAKGVLERVCEKIEREAEEAQFQYMIEKQ